MPTGALECAVGNSCHLVPGSRWHLSARLPPQSLDARAGLTRKRRRGWEHDADREAASAAVTQGVFLPLSGPVSGLGQDGTSPAHGLREDPGDRAGLRCRPQQRGNVRAQRASRWGPAGVRSAWRPGDSAAHPWGQRHPPRPPTGAEGLAEYGGGVTPGASVPSGCPKAPQSWRPETPGGGVSRGSPFWTSLEASVPGPSPGPGDSRQPLAPLASASLPHGAQSLPSPGVSLHVALRSPQRPHPNMTDHTCDSPVSRRGPLLSPERTWILGTAWPGQVVATSEAAACALEQAVTEDPPAPSALNFRVGEEHRPGGAGPTCRPRKRTPGVPEFSAFSTRSAPRARAQPRHCLCDAETGPPSPPAAPSRRAVLLAGHGASQPAEQGPPEPCAPPVPARSPLHPTRG